MKRIPISKFKAQCLAMIEGVRDSGEPLEITRRGERLAVLIPAVLKPKFGAMAGSVIDIDYDPFGQAIDDPSDPLA